MSRPPSFQQAISSLSTALPSSRFFLFLIAGGINTLFGYAIFLALLKTGLPFGAALGISTIAGICFNLQTSRRLVFRSREPARIFSFVAVYAAVLAMNYAAVIGLRHLSLQDWCAQAVMVMPMAILSFVAQRNIVFRDASS